jgi:uncharacterized membrane protein
VTGACILGFPVAATEEVWSLGAELSLGRVLVFAVVSIFLLATVIYVIHRHEGRPLSHKTFMLRVIGTYAATFAISALLLFGLDRLDVFQEPLVALKRTILVAFPASFAATVVDSFTSRS